jgi:hypothetical protein
MKILEIITEGLGYSTDPEQGKWYHEGRKAFKFGTTGNTIQDIAKKHGCPPEWLKAFHAGYQDQEGWGKGVSESKTAQSPKPRNFVAKNAMKTTSGAGAHTNAKKAAKDVRGQKHKAQPAMAEGVDDTAYGRHQRYFPKGDVYNSKGKKIGVWNNGLILDPTIEKRWEDENGYEWVDEIKRLASDYIAQGRWTVKPAQGVAEISEQNLSVQQLATISDEALDKAYGYGRSSPGNTFGWQANLKSAAYAKQMIDKGVTDIEAISDAIHKGWNVTAKAFVTNPDQFDDTEKLKAAGKLDAKLQQREKLMNIPYAQLSDEEQEKDRVVARALLQAIKGPLKPVAEGRIDEKAKSKAQQKFMGMVYAAKKGKKPASPEVAKAAKGMSKKSAKDYAATKHKDLPGKVGESATSMSSADFAVGAVYPNKKGKTYKNKDGTAKNALDVKGVNLMTGGSIKR